MCKKRGCTTDVFIRKDIEHKFPHVLCLVLQDVAYIFCERDKIFIRDTRGIQEESLKKLKLFMSEYYYRRKYIQFQGIYMSTIYIIKLYLTID